MAPTWKEPADWLQEAERETTVFVQCMEYIIPEAFDCFGPIKFKLHGVEDVVENDEDIADTLLSTITQSRAQSLLMAANLKASKLRITKGH